MRPRADLVRKHWNPESGSTVSGPHATPRYGRLRFWWMMRLLQWRAKPNGPASIAPMMIAVKSTRCTRCWRSSPKSHRPTKRLSAASATSRSGLATAAPKPTTTRSSQAVTPGVLLGLLLGPAHATPTPPATHPTTSRYVRSGHGGRRRALGQGRHQEREVEEKVGRNDEVGRAQQPVERGVVRAHQHRHPHSHRPGQHARVGRIPQDRPRRHRANNREGANKKNSSPMYGILA